MYCIVFYILFNDIMQAIYSQGKANLGLERWFRNEKCLLLLQKIPNLERLTSAPAPGYSTLSFVLSQTPQMAYT